jgi:hypothetical protein
MPEATVLECDDSSASNSREQHGSYGADVRVDFERSHGSVGSRGRTTLNRAGSRTRAGTRARGGGVGNGGAKTGCRGT